MKIALAQVNPTVGDIAYNTAQIVQSIQQARQGKAELVIFPPLSITGYPLYDLGRNPQLVEDNLQALETLLQHSHDIDIVIGYAHPPTSPTQTQAHAHAALAVLHHGQIIHRHWAQTDSADHHAVVQLGSKTIILNIDPDLNSLASRMLPADRQAQLIIHCNNDPFRVGRAAARLDCLRSLARRFNQPVAFVSQAGANDALIFDGHSLVVDASGTVLAHAKAFAQDLVIVDLAQQSSAGTTTGHPQAPNRPADSPTITNPDDLRSISQALQLGIRDYVRKCGFQNVVLGLSGGVDSALVATLAAHALGPDKVMGIALPSRYSSAHALADAQQLARNLGIAYQVIPIGPPHDAFEQALAEAFAGTKPDLTEENIQARCRGTLLMAISNKFNRLLLTTGNKSEAAVGYCTLYGDMAGGLAVIGDVYKTTVYQLSHWINRQAGFALIPSSTLTKPPSAELRPNQTDQDSLPPYELLDAIVYQYLEKRRSAAQIIASGFDAQDVGRILRLIDRSEFKRRQSAPILKISSCAFGTDRHWPVVQNYSPNSLHQR
ncbi:MAG: NAD+ synthase [Phycisphaerales bacterium]|nr:NAD+ synthase [Phycisphaerales bacterium]